MEILIIKEVRKILILEIIKFVIYSLAIVYISKQILIKLLRKLAEILDLTPKTVGSIAGAATSMPELLTVFFSSMQGLISTSIYNIASSNIINLIQYIFSVAINKNRKYLSNKAVQLELGISILTILIPLLMISLKIKINIFIVPIFILLFFFFYYIRKNVYKLYKIREISKDEVKTIEEEKKWLRNKEKDAVVTSVELILVGILLFIIGNLLGNTLEKLNYAFKIPEIIIGIILGLVTSLPELITFIESQKHYSKKQSSIRGVIEATSNLFTSNMLNLFIITSIGIIVYMLTL